MIYGFNDLKEKIDLADRFKFIGTINNLENNSSTNPCIMNPTEIVLLKDVSFATSGDYKRDFYLKNAGIYLSQAFAPRHDEPMNHRAGNYYCNEWIWEISANTAIQINSYVLYAIPTANDNKNYMLVKNSDFLIIRIS